MSFSKNAKVNTKILTSLFFVCALSACAETGTANQDQSKGHDQGQQPYADTGVKNWNSLKIKLSRSSCFGTCPSYFVTIQGDGSVEFCGRYFVDKLGIHKKKIDQANVRALFDQIKAANFFELRDEYRGLVTDNPTNKITVSYDETSKTVIDYVGGMDGMPPSVTQLEAAIDETAGTAEWIGTSRIDLDNYTPPDTPDCAKTGDH